MLFRIGWPCILCWLMCVFYSIIITQIERMIYEKSCSIWLTLWVNINYLSRNLNSVRLLFSPTLPFSFCQKYWRMFTIDSAATGFRNQEKLGKVIFVVKSASNIELVLEATLYKTAAVRPPTTHHENYQI